MGSIREDAGKWEEIENFKSKKNTVKKIEYKGDYYVLKKYDPEFLEGLEIERDILERCDEKGIPVPKIKSYKDDRLILGYISGDNCKGLYDKTEDGRVKKKILSNIASWLSKFHKEFEFKKRRGDSILANFIMKKDKVYGIDFEESEDGDPFRDVGDLCTSILRLRPAFTKNRFEQINFFIDRYFSDAPVPRKDLTEPVTLSLLHYSKYSSMGELMKEWAQKIRSNGLTSISRR